MSGNKQGLEGGGWTFLRQTIYISELIFDPRKATSSFVSNWRVSLRHLSLTKSILQLQNVYLSQNFWKFPETESSYISINTDAY